MSKTNKKFYAVAIGRKPGVYTRWFGDSGAYAQVQGFKGAVYKGFATLDEARAFMRSVRWPDKARKTPTPGKDSRPKGKTGVNAEAGAANRIVIYTDGSSLGNPGPGGYGVVIPSPKKRRELSGGFRKTTNNRMELLACIVGLEQMKTPAAVDLYSDSRYVVDGMTKGWARGWQRNQWRKRNGEKALNIDLWERLLALCNRHDVRFFWVRGHAGTPENERCDQLAVQAAAKGNLAVDEGYEAK
jgi:ribonuclease HI